jgi:hypothetical protein
MANKESDTDLFKRKTIRVYLSEKGSKRLAAVYTIAEQLSEAVIGTLLMDAALECLERENYRLPIPLRFELTPPPEVKKNPKNRVE